MFPDSTNLFIAIPRQCSLNINIKADSEKQQTNCLKLYFLDFAILVNLFMILLVPSLHRSSCSIPVVFNLGVAIEKRSPNCLR